MGVPHFVYPYIPHNNEHLGCSCILPIINNAVFVFVWIYVFISLQYKPRSEIAW